MTRTHLMAWMAAGTLAVSGVAYGQADNDVRRGDAEAGIAVQRSQTPGTPATPSTPSTPSAPDDTDASAVDEPTVIQPAQVQIERDIDVRREPATLERGSRSITREVTIDMPDTAAQRELRGTVVDLQQYLQTGEQAGKSATTSQGPKALLTADGKAYLILDARSQQEGQVMAFPQDQTRDAAGEDRGMALPDVQIEREGDEPAIEPGISRTPARSGDVLGNRTSPEVEGDAADAAADMRQELNDTNADIGTDPTRSTMRRQMQTSPDLRIGQQATLNGRVMSRGGLQAILVSSATPQGQDQDQDQASDAMQDRGETRIDLDLDATARPQRRDADMPR